MNIVKLKADLAAIMPHYNAKLHFPHTNRRLPQCIIFGVRKGGTRALLQYLNSHPDIVITCDEMHFFEKDEKII